MKTEEKYKIKKRKYFKSRFLEVFGKTMTDHEYQVLCGRCRRKDGFNYVEKTIGCRSLLEGEVLGEKIVVVWDSHNRVATTFMKSKAYYG